MRVIIRNMELLGRALDLVGGLPQDGTMCVEIGYWDDMKSGAQRRTAHLWLQTIAKHNGDTLQSLKYDIKKAIGLYTIKDINGVPHLLMKSSEDLTKKEYSEFMNAIEMVAHELGVLLPHPEGEKE